MSSDRLKSPWLSLLAAVLLVIAFIAIFVWSDIDPTDVATGHVPYPTQPEDHGHE